MRPFVFTFFLLTGCLEALPSTAPTLPPPTPTIKQIAIEPDLCLKEWNNGKAIEWLDTSLTWWATVNAPLKRVETGGDIIITCVSDPLWNVAGLWDGTGIVVNLWRFDNYLRYAKNPVAYGAGTLGHEIGHALGLDHVDEKLALMFSETGPHDGLTDADIVEYNRVHQGR